MWKSTFGWKLTVWGGGQIRPLPPRMCCGEKIIREVGEGGVKMKNFVNKKRPELLSRKSQKIQNNRISQFLTVDFQKRRSDRTPPAPLRVKEKVEPLNNA